MKSNRTMDELKSILEKTRIKKGEPFTHVTKKCPDLYQGSYYIPKELENAFLTAICNAVRKNLNITVAEKPGAYTPLRVDFDFCAKIESGINRQYNETHLRTLVGYYQDEIRNIVDVAEFREEMLTCIILEKEAPRVEGEIVKDGFHFHFPNFICDSKLQDIYLKDKITAKLIENNFFSSTKIVTKPEKIIDMVATKEWMMYGAMNWKSEKSTPYTYNRRQSDIHNSDILLEKDPWKKVKNQWGRVYDGTLTEIPITEVFENEMIGRKNSIKYYLPMFMTIRGFIEAVLLKPEIIRINRVIGQPTFKNRKGSKRVINKNKSDTDVYQDIKLIQDGHIMDMISSDRADYQPDWFDVGITLFNVTNGKEEGLQMWIDFSQKSCKYKPGECEDLWDTFEIRNKTVGSLLRMARLDSPLEYSNYKKSNTNSWLYKSVYPEKCNEYDVAMVTVSEIGDAFKCADPKRDLWYVFYDHRWHKTNDAIALKRKLVDDVIQTYYDFNAELGNLMAAPGTEIERAKYKDYIKRTLGIIDSLKHVSFQKHVIEMCKIRLTDETFLDKIDENRMLVCCENGVLDLDLGQFRDGRPDDYCTFSTGIHFQEYDQQDEDVIYMDDFMRKLFPNDNLREYYLDMLTSCLQGGNVNKRIFICTGATNGGKSVAMKLAETAFGNYFGKFPRELFLRGRGSSSSSARPELARCPGKRVMSTQEITHMDNFDIGPLKELSGNDSVNCRGLYKEGGDKAFQFSIILQCNEPPKIPGHDDATWGRIRLVDFESKFVIASDLHLYPVPVSVEEQFKMKRFHADTSLGDNLKYLAPVLLWKLFHHFPVYKKRGLKEPKEVLLSTENYKGNNDIYIEFIKDKLQKIEDEEEAKNSFILLAEVYYEFKDWYKENHPSYAKREEIGKGVVRKEVAEKLGFIKDPKTDFYGYGERNKKCGRFWGYKIIEDDQRDEKNA